MVFENLTTLDVALGIEVQQGLPDGYCVSFLPFEFSPSDMIIVFQRSDTPAPVSFMWSY